MHDLESERELLDEAVGGNRTALSQLLLLHFDDLHRHVESRISTRLQGLVRADDVMQQTFIRAAQAIDSFELRHAGAFRGWLKTIADNLVRDAEKRRRRERRHSFFDWRPNRPAADVSTGSPIDGLAGDHSSPSRRFHRREVAERIKLAMAGLPADQRDVLRRRYLLGQSLDNIAEDTDRSKDAVRGICFRARKSLRAVMGRSSLYFSH